MEARKENCLPNFFGKKRLLRLKNHYSLIGVSWVGSPLKRGKITDFPPKRIG